MKELDYCKTKGQTDVSSKKLRENWLFSLLESTLLYFCIFSSQEERDFFPSIYCFKCMSKITWPYFFEDVYLEGTKLSNQIHIQTHILMHMSGWVCILEWVSFPFSRGSSQPRDWTQVSLIVGRFFTVWATRVVHIYICMDINYVCKVGWIIDIYVYIYIFIYDSWLNLYIKVERHLHIYMQVYLWVYVDIMFIPLVFGYFELFR